MTSSPALKTALITGASSGIGSEFARQLAADGYQLVLTARRQDRLDALIDELHKDYPQRMEALAYDLANPKAPQQLMGDIKNLGLNVDVLINNAGYAPSESFSEQSLEQVRSQLQVMITSLTELAWLALPHMQNQRWGRLINVASLAAFAPPAHGTLYSAIKQYVLAFSQSLDMNVKSDGIHVTALCPGFTHTEFHQGMLTSHIAERVPELLWSQSPEVVRAGLNAVNAGRPVVVPGSINKILGAIGKRLPVPVGYFLGKRSFS